MREPLEDASSSPPHLHVVKVNNVRIIKRKKRLDEAISKFNQVKMNNINSKKCYFKII